VLQRISEWPTHLGTFYRVYPGEAAFFAALELSDSSSMRWRDKPMMTPPFADGLNPPPSVTVVVVNFNGGELVLACLDALSRQTFRDFLTVVVDNHSNDGSLERITAAFPNVRILPLGYNAGFAAGVNHALANVALGEWVALLNPDAFPAPDWLAQWLSAAAESTGFDAFGCRMYQDAAGRILDGVGDAYHVSGLPWRQGHGCPAAGHSLERCPVFAPCAAAALYRTHALRAVQGFDEDLFCYVEDVDLGFRLRLAGYRALYVPEAAVHHIGSGVVGVRSDFQLYHGHRNLVWIFVKNMPGVLFWLFLPLHLIMTLTTLLWLGLQGEGRIVVRAKWDAVKGLPRYWQKRRAVQATRRVPIRHILSSLTWNPFSHC
jgi:GT2 family glycosyltransferase